MGRKRSIAIYTIIWLGGVFLWKLFEDRLVSWANSLLDPGVKAVWGSIPKLIVWMYANPIWTTSAFVGIYATVLLSLVYIPDILQRIRSRGIKLVESLIQADKSFINPETPQWWGSDPVLASGDVAVVEIANNGLPANIVSNLQFKDAHNKRLRLVGRWTDSPLPVDPQAAVPPITIGTGEQRVLDIAVRFSGAGPLWFALDNRSPFAVYRVPGYDLLSPVIAEVVIHGNVGNKTIKRRWFFLLVSDGSPRILRVKSERRAKKLIQRIARGPFS